jgi:hypothetical protein
VNPAAAGQPAGLFAFISADGSTNVYPNALGVDSWHADDVAGNFYGMSAGISTNVAHIDSFEADYFVNGIIGATSPPDIGDQLVNQSFTFGPQPVDVQQEWDSLYDNYSETYGTLFVSAVNNGGQVCVPGTSYNCIGVAAYGGASSIGPTIDNGRCKPDITAPPAYTSFSTPQVSGAAAVLMQAALRGDGGGDTNSASEMRTIKALLLNGAIKPDDWTNVAPSPLDYRYGAGVLNVFNSYKQLAGGKHAYIVSKAVFAGGAHPPTGATGTLGVLSGWDFNTGTSGALNDSVNHYYFNVTNNLSGANFTATATLVWNRQQNQTNINNLCIFLYNCANSNLVACSTSLVDNVQHIFLPALAQGRYDLQVWKAGGFGIVSFSEQYALAWEFFSQSLNTAAAGTNMTLSWPVYPDGFVVESTASLVSPAVWSANNIPSPVVTNNQNYILLNATNASQFFRLRRP